MQSRMPVVLLFVVAIAGLVVGVMAVPPLPVLLGAASTAPSAGDGVSVTRNSHAPPAPVARKYPDKTAPAFSLPDQNGVIRSLAEAKGKWVVLAFYPMDNSGGCTMQNKSYTEHRDEFAPLNAMVYAISTQDPESKKAFVRSAGLKHTLLSDVGGRTAQAYGTFMPGANIASRVTFYIRPDGTIAGVDDNVHLMTAAQDSLAMLKNLQAAVQTPSPDPAVARSVER